MPARPAAGGTKLNGGNGPLSTSRAPSSRWRSCSSATASRSCSMLRGLDEVGAVQQHLALVAPTARGSAARPRPRRSRTLAQARVDVLGELRRDPLGDLAQPPLLAPPQHVLGPAAGRRPLAGRSVAAAPQPPARSGRRAASPTTRCGRRARRGAAASSARCSSSMRAAPSPSAKIVHSRTGTIVACSSARSSTASWPRATRSSQARSFRLRRSGSSPNSDSGTRLTSAASPPLLDPLHLVLADPRRRGCSGSGSLAARDAVDPDRALIRHGPTPRPPRAGAPAAPAARAAPGSRARAGRGRRRPARRARATGASGRPPTS